MLGQNWGATPAERSAILPCDELVSGRCVRADRAVTIAAPPTVVFAWLCQLRAAPYSYDVIDNFGRRSPRQRTPELTQLETGQRFMTVFTLHSFVAGEEITLHTRRVAVTYAVRPVPGGTRLHVRVLFEGPVPIGRLAALGDLVMTRKQLLTLKSLAENECGVRPRARRREQVGHEPLIGTTAYDYADAFEIDVPEGETRPLEQLFRSAVDASPTGRWVPLIHRHVLRLSLEAIGSGDHLFGWRIMRSQDDVLHLEAAGPLIRGIIVGRRTATTVTFTTFVVYTGAAAPLVWALVGPLHRRAAPYLLERAVASWRPVIGLQRSSDR